MDIREEGGRAAGDGAAAPGCSPEAAPRLRRSDVRDRASARGESWVPPLGPERADGPLEPPECDDALDEDDDPNGPEGDESGRAPSERQGDDEGAASGRIALEEPGPSGDDPLFASAMPDH